MKELCSVGPIFEKLQQTTAKKDDQRVGQEKGENPFENSVDLLG